MFVNRNYSLTTTFIWSHKPFTLGFLYAVLICGISYFSGISLSFPWQPLSVIGIAVAFYLGFKNNSSYDRTWEARKIWGAIVNDSRSFGAATCSFVQGEKASELQKELIYRHIAWMTALRHQLRLSRPWEHTKERLNKLYNPIICEDYNLKLDGELAKYLKLEEIAASEKSTNRATQILKRQSVRLQELRNEGVYEDFRHMEFFHIIQNLYADQGKAERIKNFPFPRQYASTALWLTLVFSAFLPFGLIDVFKGENSIFSLLLCAFVSAIITWIFFLMEKIGDYSENPFEGTYNDVPITSIARSVEIDLREMINDSNIPPNFEAENGFLM
jgi:putative membrane protein